MSTASSALKRPKVIIVGAGLGGVVLGALLEKAGVDFDVYERAPIVKPLGIVLIQQTLTCFGHPEHKVSRKTNIMVPCKH